MNREEMIQRYSQRQFQLREFGIFTGEITNENLQICMDIVGMIDFWQERGEPLTFGELRQDYYNVAKFNSLFFFLGQLGVIREIPPFELAVDQEMPRLIVDMSLWEYHYVMWKLRGKLK